MSRKLARGVEKAEACLRAPNTRLRTLTNAAPIMILTDTREEMQPRIDVLIAAGNLTEADRPRCVFWQDVATEETRHEEWVRAMEIDETDEDRRRKAVESAERAAADVAEAFAGYPGGNPMRVP